MMKRIASAFLALLILVSALPLGAAATPVRESEIGETVRLPAQEEPGKGWEPDGENWEHRKCELEGHVHTEECIVNNALVCVIPEGTHLHTESCGYFDLEYQWIYTGNGLRDVKPVGVPTDLTVHLVDALGDPIPGVAFHLETEDGAFAQLGVGEDGEYNNPAITDENGNAVLRNIALPASQKSATWILKQSDLGEFEDVYVMSDKEWAVTVTRDQDSTLSDEDNTYSLSVADADETVYDSANRIIQYTNELQGGFLKVELAFENGVRPKDSYTVELKKPDGTETLVFDGRDSISMPITTWGEYSVELKDAQVDGYKLKTKYLTQFFGKQDAPVEGSSMNLNARKGKVGIITITNTYKQELPDVAVARTRDADTKLPLGGVIMGVYLTENASEPYKTMSDSDNDGTIDVPVKQYMDKVSGMLLEGETEKVYLRQAAAPEGYQLSENRYTAMVSLVDGEIEYEIPGAIIDSANGVLYLDFENKPSKGVAEVQINFANDEIPEGLTEIPVTISGGAIVEQRTVKAEDGWKTSVELPLGTYTVTQDENAIQAAGYAVETTYENQELELKENGDKGICTITNSYRTPKNVILIQAVNEDGKVLEDARFRLKLKDADQYLRIIEKTSGSYFVLDDLENSGEYTLDQYRTGTGYIKSDDTYTITVKNTTDGISMKAKKDAGFFSRFWSDGVEVGENGEQVITFVNAARKGKLSIRMECQGDVPVEKIPLTVKGVELEETVEMSDNLGWDWNDEVILGWFTFEQPEAPIGYSLTTEYQVEGGTMQDGKLVVAEGAEEVSVTIVNNYKEEKLETLLIESRDQFGRTLKEAAVTVYFGENEIQEVADGDDGQIDGVITVTGIDKLVESNKNNLDRVPGQSIVLTLKQSKAPVNPDNEGQRLAKSTDSYDITVEKVGDKVVYGIEGKTPSGGMVQLGYTNTADSGKLKLSMKFQEDKTGYELENPPESVTVRLVGETYQKDVVLTKAKNWTITETLPYDSYILDMDKATAQVEGYELLEGTSQTVKIFANKEETYTISNVYKDTESVSRRILVRVINEKGDVLKGAEFEIDAGGTKTKLTTCDSQGWYSVKRNPKVNFTIKQTKVATNAAFKNKDKTFVGTIITTEEGKRDFIITTEPNEMTALGEQEVFLNADASGSGDWIVTFVNIGGGTTSPAPEVPDVEMTGKLIIRTVNENGVLWGGAKYGLFYGSTEIRSFTDYGTGTIHIDDPGLVMGIYADDLVAMGAPLSLKQTRAPEGAKEISDRVFSVFVIMKDGKIALEAEGAEVDYNGDQIVEFTNYHPPKDQPVEVDKDESTTIVIRTMDDAGNMLTGAEYCLSRDQYYDKDEDMLYSETDRHDEIVLKDLSKCVENGQKDTLYLLQCRQPNNSRLSTDKFKVELSKKNGKLDVKVKKEENLFDTKSKGTVEEGTDGEWIVTFVSSQKTTAISMTCNEVINWNNSVVMEDLLQNFKQSEYEFLLHWEYQGMVQEPKSLKLRSGETGTFEPIPHGANYEIVAPQEASCKTVVRKGAMSGKTEKDAMTVEADMVYDVIAADPMTIEMIRVDAQTEEPLSGAVYVLKDKSGEEVDTYKTRNNGKFIVDAITAPGEYTLTETETPQGYGKIKKDIAINVAMAFEKSTDAMGEPVILQKMEAEVNHSMVKQQSSGTYRIGNTQDNGKGFALLLVGAGLAAAGAAGAGTLLYKRRKKSK